MNESLTTEITTFVQIVVNAMGASVTARAENTPDGSITGRDFIGRRFVQTEHRCAVDA